MERELIGTQGVSDIEEFINDKGVFAVLLSESMAFDGSCQTVVYRGDIVGVDSIIHRTLFQ